MRHRTAIGTSFLAALFLQHISPCGAVESVYPGKQWAARSPVEVDLDPVKLDAFSRYVGGRGCVVRHGYMVYTWGDVSKRADVALEVALGGKNAEGKPVTWVLRGFAGGQIQSATAGGAMAETAQALLKQVVYKSEIRENDWRSEWIIPLDALGVDSDAGRPLPFNITAWRSENAEFRQYAGSLGETWDLKYGGRLVLPVNK